MADDAPPLAYHTVKVHGRGAGPVLLLLHGFPSSSKVMFWSIVVKGCEWNWILPGRI